MSAIVILMERTRIDGGLKRLLKDVLRETKRKKRKKSF